MSAVLYDLRGNPITSPDTRKKAEEQLKEFVQKYHSRFQDWVTEHGTKRPPIFYDLKNEEWVWV